MLLFDCVSNNKGSEFRILPLVHSTSTLALNSILSSLTLRTQVHRLGESEEDLAFFSYGRPAYRASKGQAFRQRGAGVCALILDPSVVKDVAHVFPFDTGAFDDYKQGPIHSEIHLEAFDCGKALATCNAIVVNYWKSLTDYIDFNVEDGLRRCICNNFVCKMYQDLLRGIGAEMNIDDRRGSIEISVASSLQFEPQDVLGLVMPTSAMGLPPVLSTIQEANKRGRDIALSDYPYVVRPEEHFGEVVNLTNKMLGSFPQTL